MLAILVRDLTPNAVRFERGYWCFGGIYKAFKAEYMYVKDTTQSNIIRHVMLDRVVSKKYELLLQRLDKILTLTQPSCMIVLSSTGPSSQWPSSGLHT